MNTVYLAIRKITRQRDNASGYPVGSDEIMRAAYGKIPDATKFQSMAGRTTVPYALIGWQWSATFNRWGAFIIDGEDTAPYFTYPVQ